MGRQELQPKKRGSDYSGASLQLIWARRLTTIAAPETAFFGGYIRRAHLANDCEHNECVQEQRELGRDCGRCLPPAIDTHHWRPPLLRALRRAAALGPDPGPRPPPTPASTETAVSQGQFACAERRNFKKRTQTSKIMLKS